MISKIAHSDISRKTENRYFPQASLAGLVYGRGMKLRLKELRLSRELTQRQVAELAGMSVSYYTELELGKKQINANRLQALARVFGVAPQALIDGSDSNPTSEILGKMDQLSPDQQQIVLALVRSLAASR